MAKKITDESKQRNHWYIAMLYPADEMTQVYHERLLAMTGVEWLRILHDKDVRVVDGEEVPDKAHYHYQIYLPNAKTQTAFYKALGVKPEDERKFWPMRKDRPDEESGTGDDIAFKKYMLHQTYQAKKQGKHQYKPEEVEGNCLNDFMKAIDTQSADTEDIQILHILDYLESTDEYVSTSKLIRECVKQGWWSTLRRSGQIGMRVLDEHNERVHTVIQLQQASLEAETRVEARYARREEMAIREERKG